jgi:uncharacterized damage-inducible protein DinB
MQDINNLGLLLKHMEWADAKVWQSVLKHDKAKNDSILKGFLFHIHMVQRAFYYIWIEEPVELPKETDFPKLIDIAKWGGEYYMNINKYFKSLDEIELEKKLEIPWANKLEKIIGKKPVNPTLGETMLQVTMHTAYHRGQVNKRLREIGGDPQLIDFIVWIWEGKPKADWKF